MRFSDLFKDKYQSSVLREYIEKLIRDMTDLKRENYYDMEKVNKRKKQITEMEVALKELGIEVGEGFDPDLSEDDYE